MSTRDMKKGRRTLRRIIREIPPVGSEFIGRSHGKRYSATVIAAPSYPGGRAIQIGNTVYSNLSSAANGVTGYKTNGWRFWKPKQ